ncbi:MAG: MBL fold metallo-hydrolase [bacterium]
MPERRGTLEEAVRSAASARCAAPERRARTIGARLARAAIVCGLSSALALADAPAGVPALARAAGGEHPAPTVTCVADGIYLFATQPYGDVGLDGNSIVILSNDGVLVFDSNGTPAAAAAVLAEIRKLTDQPVRYLVHSHWHWDHWYGAEVYRDSFPEIEIIAHETTRSLMAGPVVDFNEPGLETELPAHIASVGAELAALRNAAADAPEATALEEHIARDRAFLEQKRAVRHTIPNLTFTDSLTIHLGERLIKVLHYDRAITPGDAFLHLPNERIVVTGDLLINPITFALFCYPSGWIRTLERIDSLDAAILVPGHGVPMRNESLLHATIALLKREHVLAETAKAGALPVDDAIASILADAEVLALRTRITAGNAARNDAFAIYLVDWFVRRVYQEADGPLDGSIPSAP